MCFHTASMPKKHGKGRERDIIHCRGNERWANQAPIPNFHHFILHLIMGFMISRLHAYISRQQRMIGLRKGLEVVAATPIHEHYEEYHWKSI